MANEITPPPAPAKDDPQPLDHSLRMRDKIVVRVVSKALIPFILLFALYVQFHGDYSPGGGFQAGVIFAAGLILYALVFSLRTLKRVVSPRTVRVCMAVGVLIFAGVGVYTMFAGGNFLDYDALDPHDTKHAQHLGILLVEAGVGLTVAASMVGIFFLFAGRRRIDREVK